MKVLILKGLPASGKSTFAKALVHEDYAYGSIYGRNWKRVNKDELRAMLDNSKHTKGNENFVLKVRDFIIEETLKAGNNVVVDDTNLNPIHENQIRELAKYVSAQIKRPITVDTKFFDVPLEECIRRDLQRQNSVGERVIKNMYNEHLKPADNKEVVVYEPKEGKPDAIIVDIDGTLAHMTNGRSPYDYKRAIDDEVDAVVSHMVKLYSNTHEIIICSGREDDCRDVTEKWLSKHEIYYSKLLMRKAGDHRKDNIVKRELFDEHIRDNYNVKFVLDDRDQVVEMWRNELGLKVLQVAYGNF